MSTNVATSWPNRVLTYCSSMYSMDVLSYSLLFSPCFFCLHSQSYTCLFGFDSQLIFRNFIAKLSGEPSSMCRIDSGCAKKKPFGPGPPLSTFAWQCKLIQFIDSAPAEVAACKRRTQNHVLQGSVFRTVILHKDKTVMGPY